MGFINLGKLNIRKRNSCARELVSLSDVQPSSVYKSHILNGPINKLYISNTYHVLLFIEASVKLCVQRCIENQTFADLYVSILCLKDTFLIA